MTYVDSHCHIDRYDDPTAVMRRAEAANVVTIAVTELPSAFQRLSVRLGKRRFFRLALGLHPLRVSLATSMELALFAQLLDRVDYVGEVGLDHSRDGRPSFPQQVKVFERLLQNARVKDKILTVHSRGAEKETIQCLAAAEVTAILHWYSGALTHIDAAVEAGLWFSVNSAMLRSKNGQRIIRSIPRERIVTETDGPYVKVGRQASEPRDIPGIVKGLANIWNEDPEYARERVLDTMRDIAQAAWGGSDPTRSPSRLS